MLNYLAHATRPDVTMVVHQFATFCKNPKLSHEKSVNRIFKHLLGTRHMCIQAKTNVEAGLLAHADQDFANGQNKLNPDDLNSLFSRAEHVIFYMNTPIAWCSKFQLRIALSSTEAKHALLSTCLRDVIPIMNLINEIYLNIKVEKLKPIIKSRLFEDNESCIKIAW